MYLNFAETPREAATFWTEQAYHRLRRIKAAVDPQNIIRANHPIPPTHSPSSYFASKTSSSLNTGRSSTKPPSPNT
jgi:hypothetical protein